MVKESRTRLTPPPPPPPLAICGSVAAAARLVLPALLLTALAGAFADSALAHPDNCGSGKTKAIVGGQCVETKYLGMVDFCLRKIRAEGLNGEYWTSTKRCYPVEPGGGFDLPPHSWCHPFKGVDAYRRTACEWDGIYSPADICRIPATDPRSYDTANHRPNCTAPEAPRNVQLRLNRLRGLPALFVSWEAATNDGGSDISRYVVESSVSPFTNWSPVDSGVREVSPDLTYKFRVAAVNGVGPGAWAESESYRTASPEVPTKLTVHRSGNARALIVSWEPPEGGSVDDYHIERKRDGSPSFLVIGNRLTILSHTDSDVVPGRHYQYRVCSRNFFGTGACAATGRHYLDSVSTGTLPEPTGNLEVHCRDYGGAVGFGLPANSRVCSSFSYGDGTAILCNIRNANSEGGNLAECRPIFQHIYDCWLQGKAAQTATECAGTGCPAGTTLVDEVCGRTLPSCPSGEHVNHLGECAMDFDCAALNRFQKNPAECRGCLADYFPAGSSTGPCVREIRVSLSFSAGGVVEASREGDSEVFHGEAVPYGATVNFAAQPEDGYYFVGWGGVCGAASGSSCAVTMTLASSPVRGDFACVDFHEAARTGHLAGVSCNLDSGANANTLNAQMQTPLALAAANGYAAAARLLINAGGHYGEACESDEVVNPDSASPPCLGTESVSIVFSAGGTVSASWGGGLDLGSGGLVATGATVTFSAMAEDGYRFSMWTGACAGDADSDLQCAFAVTMDATVGAVFGCADFHASARDGVLAGVACNLDAGADADAVNGDADAPLHLAAAGGWLAVVNTLLARNADVNAPDGSGETPLSRARAAGREAVALRLIAAGGHYGTPCAPPDRVNPASSSPPCLDYVLVSVAASAGGTVSVSWSEDSDVRAGEGILGGATVTFSALPEAGYSLSLWGGICEGAAADADCVRAVATDATVSVLFSCTDLHAAAAAGDSARVASCVLAGADVNAPDESGKTPLHLAAGEGHLEAVRELLTLGATLNASDDDGDTPLTEALDGGHVEIFDLLAAAGGMHEGAECGVSEVPNPDGKTPPCVSCGTDEIISDGVCESCGLGEVVSGGVCECDSSHRRINEICVHETESLPEDRTTCADVFGGDWVDLSAAHGVGKGVCSGVDINDTFCLAGTGSALPCLGLFNHVRSCNLLGRPALDPFHCGKSCAGGKASGARCLESE